jgi:hypothetical protein
MKRLLEDGKIRVNTSGLRTPLRPVESGSASLRSTSRIGACRALACGLWADHCWRRTPKGSPNDDATIVNQTDGEILSYSVSDEALEAAAGAEAAPPTVMYGQLTCTCQCQPKFILLRKAMATLLHEVWEEPDGQGGWLPSLCLAGPDGDDFRDQLASEARCLRTFTAGSHFEAMTIYHRILGREPYVSSFSLDYESYPDSWARRQNLQQFR